MRIYSLLFFNHGFPGAFLALSGAIYLVPDIAIYSEGGESLFQIVAYQYFKSLRVVNHPGQTPVQKDTLDLLLTYLKMI